MSLLKLLLHLIWIAFLTVLTQIGGLIWIITLIIIKYTKWKKRYTFPILYFLFNLILIPPIAKYYERVQLPVFNKDLKPRSIVYSLMFRNYVNPKLSNLLKNSAKTLSKENIQITYLDANFPFYDGFPLLPHRSHNDGKKIDISFMYKTKEGILSDKKPSLSGYGDYAKEDDYTSNSCIKKGYWQYDFPKHLTLGIINDLEFDAKNTKKIIISFLAQNDTEKIFIEPYLKESLGLNRYNKIRFHSCKAVRHDDHIHLQVK